MLILVRLRSAALVALAAGLLLTGCGKKEEQPQAVPLPSAPEPVKAVPDPQPTQTAAAPTAAPTGTEAAVTPPATAAAPATTAPVAQASIDACCKALADIQSSGLPAATKAKAAQASGTCSGIAKLVKEGKASRTSALTQIRVTMGGSVPAACN
jgi:hypothetical protein